MTMTSTSDRIVSDYLHDLQQETADLPPRRREELLADVSEHIAVSRAELATDDEEAVRAVLHRLGAPGQIAAQARMDAGPPTAGGGAPPPWPARPGPGGRGFEIITVVVLLASILIPVLAGLAGLVMAWTSHAWSKADKLVATALAVVTAFFAAAVLGAGVIVGPIEALFLVPILATTVGTTFAGIFLAVRLRNR